MKARPSGAVWARVVDMSWWRSLAGSRGFRRVRATAAARKLDVARLRVDAQARSLAEPRVFDRVDSFVVFIGTVKSGGTLLGAMLDAHPHAVIADEVDVVRLVGLGLDRRRIGHVLRKGAKREAQRGRITARRLGGYSVAVPGQWQGSHTEIRVLGSTRAGPTTRQLGADPRQLDAIAAMAAPWKLKVVHVVRNPFDSMSAMALRSGRPLDSAVADYVAQTERVLGIRAQVADTDLLTVRYEELVQDPVDELIRVCEFLELDLTQEFLEACSGLIDPDWGPERDAVDWPRDLVEQVHQRLGGVEFLRGLWSAPTLPPEADVDGAGVRSC